MGGKLKSLSLSGARKAGSKAMRKLFGRESPAVNGGSCDPDVQTPAAKAKSALATAGANNGPRPDSHPGPEELVTSAKQHDSSLHAVDGPNGSSPVTVTTSQPTDAAVTTPQLVDRDDQKNTNTPSKLEPSTGTDDDTTMRVLQSQNLQQQRVAPKYTDEGDRPLDVTAVAAAGKENQSPAPAYPSEATIEEITKQIREVSLIGESQLLTDEQPSAPVIAPELDEEARAEQVKHLGFMEEALEMARLALRTNETPVGCVLVHEDKVIARGMNATNVTRNGTRHAEFMALSALLSVAAKEGPRSTCLKPKFEYSPDEVDDDESTASRQPDEGNEDGRKGHLYPYGQKEHPDDSVHPDIVRECTLYVTVEPCIMCASLLRQMGIKKVYFGAVNDKFGGTGGVFSIHANSLPVSEDGQTASAHPVPPPTRLPGGGVVLGTSFPPSGGDGGNVEPGFEIEGGWGRDDAVGLLRRFYVQENERAPIPRKKEGRAARLAAMMQEDSASETGDSGGTQTMANGDDTTYPSASEAGDTKFSASEDDDPANFRND